MYYSYRRPEMLIAGVQEGELCIYTGAAASRRSSVLTPNSDTRNAFVYLWRDDDCVDLGSEFHSDRDGIDTMTVQAGEDTYCFIRDKDSGYLRQVSGPARPITVGNLESTPLRVDTFLGKFEVFTGMLRLDENTPQRRKKKVLLTLSPNWRQPVESAALWTGRHWQALNVCRVPAPKPDWAAWEDDAFEEEPYFVVRDGAAVVQCLMTCSRGREIYMLDAPEPEPDYQVYVTGDKDSQYTLRFDATDHRDGLVVPRRRNLWLRLGIYPLKQVRDSLCSELLRNCGMRLSELESDAPPPEVLPPLFPEPPEDYPE